MKVEEAVEWVKIHDDFDDLDPDDLGAAFAALYGREPDQDDYDVGLWSLCCAALE